MAAAMGAYFRATKVVRVSFAEVMREVVHAMCDEAAAQLTLHSLATIGKGTRVSHMEHRQQNVWAQKHHERVQQSSHDFTSDHAQRNTFDRVLYTMCWLAYCVHIKATKQFHTKHGAHQETKQVGVCACSFPLSVFACRVV